MHDGLEHCAQEIDCAAEEIRREAIYLANQKTP
jgi:hypothetical protein